MDQREYVHINNFPMQCDLLFYKSIKSCMRCGGPLRKISIICETGLGVIQLRQVHFWSQSCYYITGIYIPVVEKRDWEHSRAPVTLMVPRLGPTSLKQCIRSGSWIIKLSSLESNQITKPKFYKSSIRHLVIFFSKLRLKH